MGFKPRKKSICRTETDLTTSKVSSSILWLICIKIFSKEKALGAAGSQPVDHGALPDINRYLDAKDEVHVHPRILGP